MVRYIINSILWPQNYEETGSTKRESMSQRALEGSRRAHGQSVQQRGIILGGGWWSRAARSLPLRLRRSTLISERGTDDFISDLSRVQDPRLGKQARAGARHSRGGVAALSRLENRTSHGQFKIGQALEIDWKYPPCDSADRGPYSCCFGYSPTDLFPRPQVLLLLNKERAPPTPHLPDSGSPRQCLRRLPAYLRLQSNPQVEFRELGNPLRAFRRVGSRGPFCPNPPIRRPWHGHRGRVVRGRRVGQRRPPHLRQVSWRIR